MKTYDIHSYINDINAAADNPRIGAHEDYVCTGTKRAPIVVAVDFDGTLCEDNFPEIGDPKTKLIGFVKKLASHGARIILHTCRENGESRAYLDEAVGFCIKQGIPLYAVNRNPDNPHPKALGTPEGRKVFADVYIDDKAINSVAIEKLGLSADKDCTLRTFWTHRK